MVFFSGKTLQVNHKKFTGVISLVILYVENELSYKKFFNVLKNVIIWH